MARIKRRPRKAPPEPQPEISISEDSPLLISSDDTDDDVPNPTPIASSTPLPKVRAGRKNAPKTTKSVNTRSKHPGTLRMICQAIEAIGDNKGASVQAIKKWITSNYDVDASKLRHMLKTAIEKGISNQVIVRPRSSKCSGMVGRLLLKENVHKSKTNSDDGDDDDGETTSQPMPAKKTRKISNKTKEPVNSIAVAARAVKSVGGSKQRKHPVQGKSEVVKEPSSAQSSSQKALKTKKTARMSSFATRYRPMKKLG